MSGKICPQPVWGRPIWADLSKKERANALEKSPEISKKCLANFSSNTVTLVRNPPKPLNRYFGPCGNLRLPSLMNSGWHGKPWDMTSWAPWKLHATPPLASPSRKLPWLMTPFSSVQQITSLVFLKSRNFYANPDASSSNRRMSSTHSSSGGPSSCFWGCCLPQRLWVKLKVDFSWASPWISCSSEEPDGLRFHDLPTARYIMECTVPFPKQPMSNPKVLGAW